jgi:hypothetical protein
VVTESPDKDDGIASGDCHGSGNVNSVAVSRTYLVDLDKTDEEVVTRDINPVAGILLEVFIFLDRFGNHTSTVLVIFSNSVLVDTNIYISSYRIVVDVEWSVSDKGPVSRKVDARFGDNYRRWGIFDLRDIGTEAEGLVLGGNTFFDDRAIAGVKIVVYHSKLLCSNGSISTHGLIGDRIVLVIVNGAGNSIQYRIISDFFRAVEDYKTVSRHYVASGLAGK